MLQFIEHTSKMQCNSELSNAMDVLFKRFIYIDDVPEWIIFFQCQHPHNNQLTSRWENYYSYFFIFFWHIIRILFHFNTNAAKKSLKFGT